MALWTKRLSGLHVTDLLHLLLGCLVPSPFVGPRSTQTHDTSFGSMASFSLPPPPYTRGSTLRRQSTRGSG